MQGLELIAEIGVNHDGKLESAKRLVDESKLAGFDTVKFQVFSPEALVTRSANVATYQISSGHENQHDMLSELSLSREELRQLKAHCEDIGIGFLATPFDLLSLEFVCDSLGMKRVKIGSGDLTFGRLIKTAGEKRVGVILSTGMASLNEVRMALSVYLLGRLGTKDLEMSFELIKESVPSDFPESDCGEIAILHCTSCYPAPNSSLNMTAIQTLRENFPFADIGYSDHSNTSAAGVMAVALGASLIEKHITLDKNSPGPDHSSSLEISEAKVFVQNLRDAWEARGDGQKQPQACEGQMLQLARRSLYFSDDTAAGDTPQLKALRPADGVSPIHIWDAERAVVSRNFEAGEVFSFD